MSSLKDRAIKGVFWSLLERFGNQGIQFVIGLILARLLLPEDYGLIGMILVFISLAQVFVEGGFPSALIRKNDPSSSDYSTVFWFNMAVAFLCYIILFFSAPIIAVFFDEPKLVQLTRIVGLNIIINSISIIQRTILSKDLNFKSQAKINLSSILLSGGLGVFCAFKGYGVWSLVIQNLSRNIFTSIALWISSKWRPGFVFSKNSFKELFGFGSKLLFSSLINAVSENLFSLIIGKLYNAKSLGFYTRANQFQKLPVSSIYGSISVVSYPVLSELQNDPVKLKEGYRSMIRLIAFVLFPIMAILSAVSESMIHVVLTNKWLPSVPILQILCIIGAFYPLHAINLDIIKVKGRSDLFLKLEIVKQILNISMIIICYRWGIMGLVWGSVVLNFVCYYLNSVFSKALIDYSFVAQLKDIFLFTVMSLATFVALFGLNLIVTHPYVYFAIAPFIGLGFYLFLGTLLKVPEINKIKDIIGSLLKKVKPVTI
ncbi:MAG: lipopolysaccharide biosynthesis protein [Bacteroidota bacterium]